MNYRLLFLFLVGMSLFFHSCTYRKFEELHPYVPHDSVISYSATIAPLNAAKCNGCHNVQGIGNGDFTTYAGVMVKVADTTFYESVVVDQNMPTPGSGYSITDEERHYYELWLKQGAQNN